MSLQALNLNILLQSIKCVSLCNERLIHKEVKRCSNKMYLYKQNYV